MPQVLTVPVPGKKRQSTCSSMTLPPTNVKALALAVWAVVLRPCCQTETALKRDYTTGIDSSSRYSANATHLNQSCYITRKIQVVTKWSAMVCGKTTMTGHWFPLATSWPVRCPKSCVEATSLRTEGGHRFCESWHRRGFRKWVNNVSLQKRA